MSLLDDELRWDAQLEEAEDRLYQEYGQQWARDHAADLDEQAIKQFTAERLQSAYLYRPDMARTALWMLEEMNRLLPDHKHAALVLGTSAIEITVRDLLLHPILSGLVHNEAVADAVIRLVPTDGSDAFKGVLFDVLKRVADLDLETYRRANRTDTLWSEYKNIRTDRNGFIHRGKMPSQNSLCTVADVATELLSVIFPKVVRNLGLSITGYLLIHDSSVSMAPTESESRQRAD